MFLAPFPPNVGVGGCVFLYILLKSCERGVEARDGGYTRHPFKSLSRSIVSHLPITSPNMFPLVFSCFTPTRNLSLYSLAQNQLNYS